MNNNLIYAKIALAISTLFLLPAIVLLTWRLIPSPRQEQTLLLPAGTTAISESNKVYEISQDVELSLSYPAEIKSGEEGVVRLILKVNKKGSDEDYAQPFSAELAYIGLIQSPEGPVSALLETDHNPILTWQISSNQPGKYFGSLWLMLGFETQIGALEHAALASLELETRVSQIWGMNSKTATWLGLAGLLTWGLFISLSVWLERRSQQA